MSFRERMQNLLHDMGTVVRCIGAPRKFYRLKDIPSTYNQDSLITLHMNVDPMKEKRFQDVWDISGKLFPNNAQPMWRTYVCCWAGEQALHIEGDFVECGVNLGGLSRGIVQYVDFNASNKKFYLFDTYCGLSATHITKGEEELFAHHNAIYKDCFEQTTQTFKDYPNVQLVRGTVPESLSTVAIDKVAYLSLDMNCTIPEVEALRYFWDKLSPGAIVVLDDYGWEPHRLQKQGIDALLKEKGVSVLTIPTGQGLLIKPK